MGRDPALQTMSVNLPRDLVRRVQTLAFHEGLSASSIVEHALRVLLSDLSDEDAGKQLRARGATLRRTEPRY